VYTIYIYIIATENRILNNYVSSINFFKNMFLKYIHQAASLKTLFINSLIHHSYWIWRTVKKHIVMITIMVSNMVNNFKNIN